jgi:hypothetical protein
MYPLAPPENHQPTRPHFYAAPDRRKSITDQQSNREDVGGALRQKRSATAARSNEQLISRLQ